MKFYIRKPGTSDFQLLSSFEELRTQLQAGTITTEYEVLEATGQTYGALKRSTDWMRIGKRWSSSETGFDSPADTSPPSTTSATDQPTIRNLKSLAGSVAVRPPTALRRKRIAHISIHQTSKVLAILYVALGLLFIPIGVILIIAGNTVMGIIYVLMPFIYGIIGYPLAAVMCWVYNVIAKGVGGLEFSVEDEDSVG